MRFDLETMSKAWDDVKLVVGWAAFALGVLYTISLWIRWMRGERTFSFRGERLDYTVVRGVIIACVQPFRELLLAAVFDKWTGQVLQKTAMHARAIGGGEGREKYRGLLKLRNAVQHKSMLTTVKGHTGQWLADHLNRLMCVSRAVLRVLVKAEVLSADEAKAFCGPRVVKIYVVVVTDYWTDDRFQCVRFFFFFDWEVELEILHPGWLGRLVQYSIRYQGDKAQQLAWTAAAVLKAREVQNPKEKDRDDPLPGESFGFTELRLPYYPGKK